MSVTTIVMNPIIYAYLQEQGMRESLVQRELRELTATLPGGGMQISPEQGQFMKLLVMIAGAKRILEVGTFCGYSAPAMAMGLGAEGQLIT